MSTAVLMSGAVIGWLVSQPFSTVQGGGGGHLEFREQKENFWVKLKNVLLYPKGFLRATPGEISCVSVASTQAFCLFSMCQ